VRIIEYRQVNLACSRYRNAQIGIHSPQCVGCATATRLTQDAERKALNGMLPFEATQDRPGFVQFVLKSLRMLYSRQPEEADETGGDQMLQVPITTGSYHQHCVQETFFGAMQSKPLRHPVLK
jgi:hypothetical protein